MIWVTRLDKKTVVDMVDMSGLWSALLMGMKPVATTEDLKVGKVVE